MNNKGQFSIIAALLVAVVLIGSVMATYSAIRYNPIQGQPQILSSLDESNQALSKILGFTVGYYGSVLKVTGNVTYAQQLAKNYFDSGLTNAGVIKPEWGLFIGSADLELKANWFTNESYSQGNMNVTYDLNGLGITGISYSDSSRLDVQITDTNSTTQAQFKVLTDNGEPLINLAAENIKFYRYVYENSTWDYSLPTNIVSHSDGTYSVDLPLGVPSDSFVVQVEDTRGLSVLASSFSQLSTSISWDTTGFKLTPDYVDSANWDVLGTHSDFAAQQNSPDSIYDTLSEAVNGTTYALNLEEQWTNINATNLRQELCVKTGFSFATEPLLVQIFYGGNWQNLMTLIPSYFNNVSLAPYIDSSTLTIRFVDGNNSIDPIQDSWEIDSVYIKDEPDINFLVNHQQSTFTLELLQNGTMRWLGQNMQSTSQIVPIPPIPVKAIHVNQTINGVNQEVPFQIEDWASKYQIPLGLTSNTTLFGNRQMIVFLLTGKVTDFTVWWDGSDYAVQTSLAFTNRYFADNVASRTLDNGKLRLQFGSNGFVLTSTVGSVTSTANLMRINLDEDDTDPELAYVISNGVVRDIVLGEAEYHNGIANCSNTYTNIVITLPANVTYYTYQLRAMFLDSSPRPRNISDLSLIHLSTSASPVQIQTENSTLAGSPIVQNGTGTFLNSTDSGWTAHHFSQFITNDGKGAGIMFTDLSNQKLYAFDSFPVSTSKGALKASIAMLELLPVSSSMVKFTFAYDITFTGAVATFNGDTPILNLYDGITPMGLWILVEYPPTLTVTPKS